MRQFLWKTSYVISRRQPTTSYAVLLQAFHVLLRVVSPSDAYGFAFISKLFQTRFEQTRRNITSLHLLQEVTLPVCFLRQDVGVSERT
jgi:hypothetical protein